MTKRKIVISFVNALALVFLHLVYLNMNLSMPLEDEIITALSKAEKYFTGAGKFKDSGYVFINTAYDNSLINIETEDGDSGNMVITNRRIVGKLFEKIANHGNQHRYIFCDLLFDTPSDDDAYLKAQLSRLRKIILPAHSDYVSGKITRPIFRQKWALADYVTFEGKVSKIMLYSRRNNLKTLPLAMYEDCNKTYSNVSFFGLWSNHSYIPYSIYPRYFFDSESMKKFEWRLDNVIRLLDINDSIFYDKILRDKIIVIGNFSTDMHVTSIGFMPGSMVLFNTYLTLEAKYHLHSWSWLFFLLISFSLLSYYDLFFKKEKRETKWYALMRFLSLTGLCIILSLISDIIFGIHTTVLPVIIYFQLMLFFTNLFKSKPFFMKNLFLFGFILAGLTNYAQSDITCFVTSVKGDIRFENQKTVKVGDTISYSKIKNIKFYSPGMATFGSSLGSCRAYTKGSFVSEKDGGIFDFAKDILKINGKSISLSSRGDCTCMVPEVCLSSDPLINESLLLFDTLSFPARNIINYDSCSYFLQMNSDQGVVNNKLKTDNGTVFITKNDLQFNGKYYNEAENEYLTLGVCICKWLDGKKTASLVARVKVNSVSSSLLKEYYTTLKEAMPGSSSKEIYETYYTDLYVFFGKPDQCRLKKLINYHD